MALDPERASFLLEEYRRSTQSNAGTLADYANARRIEIETNIATLAGGDALANELLALLEDPARVFEVEIEGVDVADLSAFDGSPPAFALEAARFAISSATPMLPAAIEIDHERSTTRLTIRG